MALKKMFKVRCIRRGAKPSIIRLNTENEAREWCDRNPSVRYVGPVLVDQDGNERKKK